MRVESEKYTIKLLNSHKNEIFVFGDNLKRYGKGGQAVIRDCKNAFGIVTKRYPSKDSWAYFSDKPDEIEAVMDDLRNLWKLSKSNQIVFPHYGIGTGLAMLESKSPLIWEKMNKILLEYFGFDNVNREVLR